MKLLPLRDNAFFLQNWRERMRTPAVLSAGILLLIIIIMIITNASLNDTYYSIYPDAQNTWGHVNSQRVLLDWYKKAVLDLINLQGMIILFFGTLSAYRISARERSSGTLDFHRSSPTSRTNQVLGLLLGAPCLEWCFFGCVFLADLAFTMYMPSQLWAVVRFNIALVFSALFLHTIAILMGISRDTKSNYGMGAILLISLHLLAYLTYSNKLSFLYHCTWLPAYEQIEIAFKGSHQIYRHWDQNKTVLYSLFGHKVNSLLFQLCVQIPFLAIFFKGVARKISRTDRPVFDKSILLLAIVYILFLLIGSSLSMIQGMATQYSYDTVTVKKLYSLLHYTILICGVGGAFIITPTQLVYLKGLRKIKKLGWQRLKSGDDHTSNAQWLICFSLITGATYIFYGKILNTPINIIAYSYIIILSYVIFFSSFTEYFRLSRYHLKKAVFWTTLVIFWILIPVSGQIMETIFKNKAWIQSSFAICPFYGITKIWTYENGYVFKGKILSMLIPPLVLALVTTFLAHNERRKLKKRVEHSGVN